MLSDKLARLTQLLEGSRDGYTRDQLADRLNVDDREMRNLVTEANRLGLLPILSPKRGVREHYRIAQAHEWDAVNDACEEDAKRGRKLHGRAAGRRSAWAKRYSAGDLFLKAIPDLEPIGAD